jgi:hypothetical protein
MLKMDLQISASQYDEYLMNMIKLAEKEIKKEGIVIEESEKSGFSIEDGMLIQMYAAYLYRKRKEQVVAMPRSLRYMLNNTLFSQKGKV